MIPTEGEQWSTRSEMRTIKKVVPNPKRRGAFVVLVEIVLRNHNTPAGEAVIEEWLTGCQWAVWKSSRKAVRHDNQGSIASSDN